MFSMKQLITYTFLLSIFNVFYTRVTGSEMFGYNGEKGPDHWRKAYASCVGKQQSPININAFDVTRVTFTPLKFKNVERSLKEGHIVNNGHTVMLALEGDNVPTISGGVLHGEYTFTQLHYHWGDTDDIGSENTINNISFPMELHVVFYKTPYGSLNEALSYRDGLTVLSFLCQLAKEDNKKYEAFVSVLSKVQEVGSNTSVPSSITLASLMGTDFKTYYTYDGSLTTPPCSEVVQWLEFEDKIPLSHRQIEQFRNLHDFEGYMKHNFRPVQPINNRHIFFNDESHSKSYGSCLQVSSGILLIIIFFDLYFS